ncbi:hypothetical protein CPB85DRAFT_1433370 [Mucidula mucida]|nr:hypothetical protein CPB85DRAFT_1433370 [Mucidula mucida]
MLSILVLFTTLFFALGVVAYPARSTRPQNLIVWNPKITSPKPGDKAWVSNERRNVTWSVDDIPPEKRNDTGKVVLGHWDMDGQNENLNYTHPIARDFPLITGWIECTMPPHVPSGNQYFVVLFGDSGNTSPTFSVINPNSDF